MEKSKPETTFAQALSKIIGLVERVAMAVAFAGALFKYMHWAMGSELLILGLFTIAITLFLSGFGMLSTPHSLVAVIYKLGYISSAVAVIGILFTLLRLEGSVQMLTVALPSLGGVVIMAGVFSAKYEGALKVLRPMLMRAVPLFLCCLYLFLKLPK